MANQRQKAEGQKAETNDCASLIVAGLDAALDFAHLDFVGEVEQLARDDHRLAARASRSSSGTSRTIDRFLHANKKARRGS
jgi:hypothetical protein